MTKIINIANGSNTNGNFNVIAIEKNLYKDIKNGKYYVNHSGNPIDFSYFRNCFSFFQDYGKYSIDDDVLESIFDFIRKFEGNILNDNKGIFAIPIEIIDAIVKKFKVNKNYIENIFDEAMNKTFDNSFENTASISELEIKINGETNTYTIINVTTNW